MSGGRKNGVFSLTIGVLTILSNDTHYGVMKLLIAIIKDYRKVEDILMGFLEHDVSGATVIEAQGMGQILGNIPIFADNRGFFPGSAHDFYLIMSVVQAFQLEACHQVIQQVCGPLTEPASGIVFTLPVDALLGLKSPLN